MPQEWSLGVHATSKYAIIPAVETMTTVAESEIEARQRVRESTRTLETGWRGGTRIHTLEDITDYSGTGIWVSDDFHWAKGYAERKAVRLDTRPVVEEITYFLNNPAEVDDLECSADDESLLELAGGSKPCFDFLCELRREAGWNGKEMDEPCMFEITNTPKFVAYAKSLGFDGMIGWENGNECRVVSIFDKANIVSIKDITAEIPAGYWSNGVMDDLNRQPHWKGLQHW